MTTIMWIAVVSGLVSDLLLVLWFWYIGKLRASKRPCVILHFKPPPGAVISIPIGVDTHIDANARETSFVTEGPGAQGFPKGEGIALTNKDGSIDDCGIPLRGEGVANG